MVYADSAITKKKIYINIALLFTLLIALFVVMVTMDGNAGEVNLEVSKLSIPMREVSGIDWIEEKGNIHIVAIGDRKPDIVKYDLNHKVGEKISFRDPLAQNFAICQNHRSRRCHKIMQYLESDWEAIKVDGAGDFYALQEHSESILAISSDGSAIKYAVNFDLFEGMDKKARNAGLKLKENAFGEGLLLLKNGHFAVAKELGPISIVEIGPKGDAPLGISTESVLDKKEVFQIKGEEKRVNYSVLSRWNVASTGKCDFSDMDFHDGKLYIVSQKCQQIFIFNPLKKDSGKLVPAMSIDLPSYMKNPEALTVLPTGQIVVGCDFKKKKRDNLYIVSNPLFPGAEYSQK